MAELPLAERMERLITDAAGCHPLATVKTPIEQMAEWAMLLRRWEPVVSRFMAEETVPRGRVFRYYDTHGRLWLYVNTDDVREAFPRRAEVPRRPSDMPMFGIPIYGLDT